MASERLEAHVGSDGPMDETMTMLLINAHHNSLTPLPRGMMLAMTTNKLSAPLRAAASLRRFGRSNVR